MFQRFGFGLLDPAVLADGVGVAVLGVLGGAIFLHLLIRLRHRRPGAKIIAEGKMPVDAVVPCRVTMEMEFAEAGHRFAERAEAAALQPIFPMPCLLYTSPSPRDGLLYRMPSSA